MTFQNRIPIFLHGFSFGKLFVIRHQQHNSKKTLPRGLKSHSPCSVRRSTRGRRGPRPAKQSERRSTVPDVHRVYGRIFCEGGEKTQRFMATTTAFQPRGSQAAGQLLAVRSAAEFNIEAHGPLQLQESTQSPAEVRQARRGL